MSNYSIAIILPFFLNGKGAWPGYIEWYFESCKNNHDIDFYVFTDDKSIERCKADNIHFIPMTFEECVSLIRVKIDKNAKFLGPYKLCDFKQVNGLIFSDWVKDYDFWGMCDCDMVFGDIRKYASDEKLKEYDHLYIYGHLQLKRNTPEVNEYYKLPHSKDSDYPDKTWEKVLATEKNIGFAELGGLPLILLENHKKIYRDLKSMTDISRTSQFKRMVDLYVRHNYVFQYWIWSKGHVYNVNALTHKRHERLYIHMQKRKFPELKHEEGKDLYILPSGRMTTDPGTIKLRDTFVGFELIRFYFSKIIPWIKWHLRGKNTF